MAALRVSGYHGNGKLTAPRVSTADSSVQLTQVIDGMVHVLLSESTSSLLAHVLALNVKSRFTPSDKKLYCHVKDLVSIINLT